MLKIKLKNSWDNMGSLIDGTDLYVAKEIHFHTPAEHQMN